MARVPGGFGINDVMGVGRPDRSVSLRSEPPLPPMVDPRKAAAATGGAIWFYGGYGNPPQKQIGPNSWGAAEGEYRKLADAVQKTAAEAGEAVDSANPEEVLDWLGDEPVWVELTPEGTVVPVPEPDPEAWVPDPDAVPEVVPEVVPPAEGGSLLMEGQQALPGMLTPEEDAKERERQRNLEAVEESRRRLEHGNPPEPPNHLDHLVQQQAIRDALFAIAAAGGGTAALGGFGGGGMLRGMGSGLGAFR